MDENVPEMADTFDKMRDRFDLSHSFMEKIKKAGFKRPSPVQMQTVPIMFARRNALIFA